MLRTARPRNAPIRPGQLRLASQRASIATVIRELDESSPPFETYNNATQPAESKQQWQAIRQAKPFSEFLTDSYNRQHDYLRISLTERCNLRCLYCMPEEGVELSPNRDILTTPEIEYLSRVFVEQGVTKIRLTGGEPTVRKDILQLMKNIGDLRSKGLKELALTTNGISLHRKLDSMVESGLTGVNISLDTLDPFQYQILTRRQGYSAVTKSIERVKEMNKLGAGVKLKINCVVMRGLNDHQILPFVEMTRNEDLEVRFIEYMPFGGNKWSKNKMMSYTDMLAAIHQTYPTLTRMKDASNDTSKTWHVPGFAGRVGFITSMTHNFCGTCNRLRITSDGNLKVCLHGNTEVSLRDMLRADNAGEPMDEAAFKAMAELQTSAKTNSKQQRLLDVIGAAVKRKKAKHAGMGYDSHITPLAYTGLSKPIPVAHGLTHAIDDWSSHSMTLARTPASAHLTRLIPSHLLNRSYASTQRHFYGTDAKKTENDGAFRASCVKSLLPKVGTTKKTKKTKKTKNDSLSRARRVKSLVRKVRTTKKTKDDSLSRIRRVKSMVPKRTLIRHIESMVQTVRKKPLIRRMALLADPDTIAYTREGDSFHTGSEHFATGDTVARLEGWRNNHDGYRSWSTQVWKANERAARTAERRRLKFPDASDSPGNRLVLQANSDTISRAPVPSSTTPAPGERLPSDVEVPQRKESGDLSAEDRLLQQAERSASKKRGKGNSASNRMTFGDEGLDSVWAQSFRPESTVELASSFSQPMSSRHTQEPPSDVVHLPQTKLTEELTSKLTHVNTKGEAHMVDVNDKAITKRIAVAQCSITFSNIEAVQSILDNTNKKGDVLAVARIAGIMAAKKTADLIPLCHFVPLTKVEIDIQHARLGMDADDASMRMVVEALVECTAKTGVEMEALVASQVAALTLYDMCKAIDKGITLHDGMLVYKSGGRSGTYMNPRALHSRLLEERKMTLSSE